MKLYAYQPQLEHFSDSTKRSSLDIDIIKSEAVRKSMNETLSSLHRSS